MKQDFFLRPDITFLNFGSFGACPRPIFENYQYWQTELEQEPVQFITVKGPEALKTARQALSAYVSCDADDLVFVTNPSYAMNLVVRNLPLAPGDEVLSTDLEYGACDRIFQFYCEEKKSEIPATGNCIAIDNERKFHP